MAAAKELMNRGLAGSATHTTAASPALSTTATHPFRTSTLHQRVHSHGLEPARFLLDVASGRDEAFSMHQRVVATRELVRVAGTPTTIESNPRHRSLLRKAGSPRTHRYDNRLQEWREEQRAARKSRKSSSKRLRSWKTASSPT